MAGEIEIVPLGHADYSRAKQVLNKAKHPGFVGQDMFTRCVATGSATVAMLDGQDVGVLLVASHKAQALSVVGSAQGRGVGAQLIDRVQPRWANVMQERVEWFRRRGYREVGAPKVSQKGTTSMQLMERVPDEEREPTAPTTPRERVAPTPEQARNVGAITRIMQQAIECERLMASLLTPSEITQRLMALGLTRRQARAYQAGVRRLWAQQGGYESREQRLDRYRRALEQQASAAAGEGDRKAAIAALAVLVKMEGEAAPRNAVETNEAAAKLVQDAMAQQYGAQAVIDAEGEDGE